MIMMMVVLPIAVVVVVIVWVSMIVAVKPGMAPSIYTNVIRSAAAYLAHGYLPPLIVFGCLAEGLRS